MDRIFFHGSQHVPLKNRSVERQDTSFPLNEGLVGFWRVDTDIRSAFPRDMYVEKSAQNKPLECSI